MDNSLSKSCHPDLIFGGESDTCRVSLFLKSRCRERNTDMKKKLAKMLAGLMVITLMGCAGAGNTNGSPENTGSDLTEQTDSAGSDGVDSAQETDPSESSSQDASQEAPQPSEAETPAEDPLSGLALKDLFAEHGMKVGTCLTTQMINGANTNQLILSQFNSVTMENSMKPDYLFNQKKSQEEGRLVVEFNQDAIKMMEWAKENGFSMRGHTMVWYSQTPEWIFHKDFDKKNEYVDRDEMLNRMESMMKQIFEQLDEMGYLDLFYAYDVVNEAWMEDGTMRQNHWSDIIGDDYLWYAFYYADQYAPESIDLYYNDYNEQFKTQTLIDFVNTLVDEDGRYLIDGIGFQAHLYTSDSLDDYFETVEKLGATGLKLQLTELDVCLGKYQAPLAATDENLKEQGRFYYDLISGLFERVDAGLIRMDALTFWGFADNLSWRKQYSPLLFNSAMEPKYAYYGAMQMKEQAGF